VLIFTFIWNDYFWATVLTQGAETQPVTAGITRFNGQWIAQYQLMSAGSHRRGDAAGADVLPDAETLHRRPDARRDKGIR
jgi:hypothetical protein